jgi:cbb3-type cytochrome oxidase cytochrome c subunit
MLQHFNERPEARSGGSSGASSLSMPQRNALLSFVASAKPDSLQTLTTLSPEFINASETYVTTGCASCHKVNGVGGDIGPSLNGLANRRTESWVQEHFASPRRLSAGSIMPPFHFAHKDEQDLIGYLFALPE